MRDIIIKKEDMAIKMKGTAIKKRDIHNFFF